MIQEDTVKLLRECDAGIKMGISSINDVLEHVKQRPLYQTLSHCRREHETLQADVEKLLVKYQDEGKNPNPIAKSMSKMKTGLKLGMEKTDATIADLMTDGCNMGVKSLNRYLNEYKAADEVSKDIAKRLIHLEESLTADLRSYL